MGRAGVEVVKQCGKLCLCGAERARERERGGAAPLSAALRRLLSLELSLDKGQGRI